MSFHGNKKTKTKSKKQNKTKKNKTQINIDENQQNIMAFVTGKTLTIFVEKTRNEDFCNSIGSSILHIYIYIYGCVLCIV